jgi:hypothetical protein
MKELSLHILDIAQNSISANAKTLYIIIEENTVSDALTISIVDDGVGMSEQVLTRVTDPYFTSRTTRKVGLGLPLLKQHAELTNGNFLISSQPGKGTMVTATFGYSHFDRQPLGDIGGVIMILVGANPDLHITYRHRVDEKEYFFDTEEVKQILEEMPINDPVIIRQLKEMIRENIKDLYSKD